MCQRGDQPRPAPGPDASYELVTTSRVRGHRDARPVSDQMMTSAQPPMVCVSAACVPQWPGVRGSVLAGSRARRGRVRGRV